jgi:hypothetical protein
MALINIPTSGLWSSIASILNSNFSFLRNITGWAFYEDSQYTSGSPFVVNQGVIANLPNNKLLTAIETQLPNDATTFYDGSVITPVTNGDKYTISIRFKCTSTSNTGAYALKIDIGGSQGIIANASQQLARSGVENFIEVDFTVFTGATFVANGGTVKFESIVGNTSIYDISYLISREHKAR